MNQKAQFTQDYYESLSVESQEALDNYISYFDDLTNFSISDYATPAPTIVLHMFLREITRHELSRWRDLTLHSIWSENDKTTMERIMATLQERLKLIDKSLESKIQLHINHQDNEHKGQQI